MQFRDTIERSTNGRYVPSDLVKINGVNLYDVLPGYTQLDVKGRGVVPLTVSTSSIDGQDGQNVDNATFGSIELVITYMLQSTDSDAQREDLRKLNAVLTNQREVTLEFADDNGYVYPRCYLTDSAELGNPTSTVQAGTFTFTSIDAHATKHKASNGPVTLEYADKIRPLVLRFVPNGSPSQLTFKNTRGEEIRFVGLDVPAGHGVAVQWMRDRIQAYYYDISTNKAKASDGILDKLQKYSSIYHFYLYADDNITVEDAIGDITVTWEDRAL